jgi:hypothetical protein
MHLHGPEAQRFKTADNILFLLSGEEVFLVSHARWQSNFAGALHGITIPDAECRWRSGKCVNMSAATFSAGTLQAHGLHPARTIGTGLGIKIA